MGDVPAAVATASPARKRRRGCDDGLKRVAEIVMVLAAAGEVRGGREPTAAERALVAEARERLAAAVADGSVRPKDLFPGEAVRAVVEDLGLNRAKDPAAMGFRPPKASIADRLMLTKRKMEEVKEAPTPPASTPQISVSSGMSEFHGLHGASKFGVGAPRNPQATAPLNSASLVTLKPPGPSPAKSVNNSVVAVPHPGHKDVNGPLNLARNGANIVHSTKSTSDSAGPSVNSLQSSNQVVKNQDTKPVVQAATGNPVAGLRATPGMAYVPPKNPFIHHNAIAKSVQEFLQQPTNHPSWTPPSTEYMHSRLCCQICKVVISDTDSVLICDACERGAHLVCLQNYGNKGVPKAEWHCSICLTQSKGKPLPPKYGKVTRTAVASKAAPVNGAQFSFQGSEETKATKEVHHKMAANGNSMKLISTKAGSTILNSNVLALNAPSAGSQSQLVSTLRPSVGNADKSEAPSNEKEGTGQLCSSTVENSASSPPNKRLRSESSVNSVESAKDTVHGKKTEGVSAVNCADSSFSVGTSAKTFKQEGHSETVSSRDENIVDRSKSEGHSEPVTSRDEDIVDHNGSQMEQTRTTGAEQRPKIQAPFELEKATATNTGTATTDQDTNSATEEKHQNQGTSEPDTISDMELTVPTGKPLCQNSNVGIEEKLKTDAASEPPNNPAIEDKSSEQTSAVNDCGIPTSQSEHVNGLNRNGLKKSPCGGESISGCDASSDHGSIQTLVPNGVLHPKDEMLCVSENETVGVSSETKVQAK